MASVDGVGLGDALHRLERLLTEWAQPAAVIGGIAIVARVRPRHTDDVDVVVVVPEGRAPALLDLAHRHGWVDDPKETRELIEGGLLRLFPGARGADEVGVDFIFVDSRFVDSVVQRATPVDLGVATLPVATTEDLLLLKLDAHRPEDLDDILSIKDACAGALDMGYVREQAGRLGLLERLELYLGIAAR